jgi:hypothetical protein
MSKTVTNWFARSTGSKSLARESTTSLSGTKCSSVHPQETKERDALLGNNTSSTGISNGIVDLKALEKPEVVASADVASSCDSEEEEEEGDQEEEEEAATNQEFPHLELGPQVPLKEQLEKDKEDESLRRWKEQLLGSASLDDAAAAAGGDGGFSEPEVTLSLSRKALITSSSSSSPSGTTSSRASPASTLCGKPASSSTRHVLCSGPSLLNNNPISMLWHSR